MGGEVVGWMVVAIAGKGGERCRVSNLSAG